jgi:hypothetical protein
MVATLALLAVMAPVVRVAGLDLAFFFVLGGIVSSTYVVALALLAERFRGTGLASAITVYTVMWCLGSLAGPPLIGAATQAAGPGGLPLALAAATALFIPFIAAGWWRGRRR